MSIMITNIRVYFVYYRGRWYERKVFVKTNSGTHWTRGSYGTRPFSYAHIPTVK